MTRVRAKSMPGSSRHAQHRVPINGHKTEVFR